MSRGMTIAEVAPGKEGYGHSGSQYGDEKAGDLAGLGVAQGQSPYSALPPASPAAGPPKGVRDAPEVVINRQNRLDWIDGLRGLASLIIFTHHFADLTWSQRFPNTLAEGSIEGFLR